jgi:hypothetical protein
LASKDTNNLFIKDKLIIKDRGQDMEYRLIEMDDYMKANGTEIREMERDMKSMEMEILIKASISIISHMEVDSILGQTEKLMMANGKMVAKMETVYGMD